MMFWWSKSWVMCLSLELEFESTFPKVHGITRVRQLSRGKKKKEPTLGKVGMGIGQANTDMNAHSSLQDHFSCQLSFQVSLSADAFSIKLQPKFYPLWDTFPEPPVWPGCSSSLCSHVPCFAAIVLMHCNLGFSYFSLPGCELPEYRNPFFTYWYCLYLVQGLV